MRQRGEVEGSWRGSWEENVLVLGAPCAWFLAIGTGKAEAGIQLRWQLLGSCSSEKQSSVTYSTVFSSPWVQFLHPNRVNPRRILGVVSYKESMSSLDKNLPYSCPCVPRQKHCGACLLTSIQCDAKAPAASSTPHPRSTPT